MRFPYLPEASGVPVLVTAVLYRRVLLDWADLDKHIFFKHLEANNEIKWIDTVLLSACLFAHTSWKTGLRQKFNARTGIKQAGSVVFVSAVFLILTRFVLFVLSVFFPQVVVWAEQKINESWLRAANSPTQLHAAILSGTFFFTAERKADRGMNIECRFLGLQLLVERPPDVDRHVDTGGAQWTLFWWVLCGGEMDPRSLCA